MNKFICFLLVFLLAASLCACDEQDPTESQAASAENISSADAESSKEVNKPDDTSTESKIDESSLTSTPDEGSDAELTGVQYDENGSVILSDPPTYEEVLALHMQDPETYRDPGELQPECKEMVKLEDGQWYQSFVAASYNCRFILWNAEETEATGWWSAAIGSEKNYFLFNVGVLYDDPGNQMQYEERPIAVRGTLTEGSDGYAYELRLPDELIVCVEQPANPWGGTCYIEGTETLAIPETYASLLEGKTGEVVVTGVVMQDENGVFYLKDISLYLS